MLNESRRFYDYNDVLIKPASTSISSRRDVKLVDAFFTKHSKQEMICVPIMSSNMDTTGTIEIALELQKEFMLTALHKYYSADDIIDAVLNRKLDRGFFFVSIGMSLIDIEKIKKIESALNYHPMICIDVANGYTQDFVSYIARVREEFPRSIIMAGNVATPEQMAIYDNAGVDIVKIGIGPGNFCRTRTTAGIGVPQLSAVLDCATAADALGIMICADGGINEFCDFAKAMCAGANFVMAGSMFAGHTESGGELIVDKDGNERKITYGMSSETAMMKYAGEISEYRASEGRTAAIRHKGPVVDTVKNILGSLRSTMTYTDTRRISNLFMAEMILVSNHINQNQVGNTIGI